MKHVHTRMALPAVMLMVALAAAKPGLDFGGSLSTDLTGLHDYRWDEHDEFDFSGTSRLTLTMRNTNRTHAKVEGSVDVLLLYGLASRPWTSMAGGMPLSDAGTAGSALLFKLGKAPVLLDLRKLYLEFYLPFADIAVGRQIINFGKGFVFSPIDVFSTVNVFDLDFRRQGSDVAMARIPIGPLAGVDLIAQLPLNDAPYSVAAKGFANVGGFDLSLVGIYREPGRTGESPREGVVGFTLKGDIVLGVYSEAVLHIVQDASRPFVEAMAGLDYSVNNRWTFRAEYLYKDYAWAGSTWGEHNLFGSVSFAPNELLSISGNLLYDFEHEIAAGTLLGRYNALQNVNIDLYVRGFSGVAGLPYDFGYGVRTEVAF